MTRNKPPGTDDAGGDQPVQGQLFGGAAFTVAKTTVVEVKAQASIKAASAATIGRTARAPMAPTPVAEEELVQTVDLDSLGEDTLHATAVVQEPRVFTVGELVRSARVMLETRFADVRVQGEISGLKPSGPGHIYFTLKESQAQIDCVMFSREATRLRFRPRDGMQVQCRGRLTIYEGRGKFQMTIVQIEPSGTGALALAFEELKQKLAKEGLFLEGRKRPLPFLPRCLGVVTSPTGAVIRDIVHVAHRRFPVRILLSPTPVQGEGAARQIVNALERLWLVPGVDVIVLARGGGSLEDLWPFNEEIVARAIARSPVPIISAIGHETDFTIADFVADRRAPTPSAAAEIAIPELRALQDNLQAIRRRLSRGTDRELQRARLALERLTTRVSDPRRLLDRQRQALDDLQARSQTALAIHLSRKRTLLRGLETRLLRAHPQKRIAVQRALLMALERKLATCVSAAVHRRKQGLSRMQAKLEALSPLRVLDRGYSLVRGADGHLVTRASEVQIGQRLVVTLREGSIDASVETVNVTPSEQAGKQ